MRRKTIHNQLILWLDLYEMSKLSARVFIFIQQIFVNTWCHFKSLIVCVLIVYMLTNFSMWMRRYIQRLDAIEIQEKEKASLLNYKCISIFMGFITWGNEFLSIQLEHSTVFTEFTSVLFASRYFLQCFFFVLAFIYAKWGHKIAEFL